MLRCARNLVVLRRRSLCVFAAAFILTARVAAEDFQLEDVGASEGTFRHVPGSACCASPVNALATSAAGCRQRCLELQDCQSWVLAASSGHCFLLRWLADHADAAKVLEPAEGRVLGFIASRVPWASSANPRSPLCLYYSCEPGALRNEILHAYSHRLGPGSLPAPASGLRGFAQALQAQDLALLVSHGHYLDGGPVSSHAFRLLSDRGVPRTALILGTNHRGIGPAVALSRRPWRTPLGVSLPDGELLDALEREGYPADESGHSPEHSIENQLPFLQHLRPDVRIAPVGLSHLGSLEEVERLARAVVAATRGRDVLLMATTDFTHAGGPYPEQPPDNMPLIDFVRMQDASVVQAVASGDPGRLLEAAEARGAFAPGMCGFWPAMVLMRAAALRGLSRVTKHQYAVSIEAVPNDGATGFAAFSFSRP